MKLMIKVLTILFLLLVLSCGLDRSNPLDPENGNIDTPKLVTNISLSSSGSGAMNKFVIISWTPLEEGEADGYYVYRSRSYDGTFDLIADVFDRELSSYTDNDKIVTGAYFYKMSAYLYLNPASPNDNERLEGPLNRPGNPGISVPQ